MRKLFFLIMLVGSCQQAMASQIVNPAASGAGGSGGIVSPGTFTWTNSFGIQASTLSVTSDNTTNALGTASLGQLANVGSANGILNSNFQFWTSAASNQLPGNSAAAIAASNWGTTQNISGCSGNIDFIRVSTITTAAQYAIQIKDHSGFSPTCAYEISQSIPNYYDYLGSTVTLTAWANTATATTIGIGDGISISTSAAHPGDGNWHQLSVTRYISPSATSLTVLLNNLIGNGGGGHFTHYFDGVMLVPGNAPINHIPQPIGIVGVTDGSDATSGQVGESTSTFVAQTSPITAVNGTYVNIDSVLLSAGDWDVNGVSVYAANSGTGLGRYTGCVSAFSGNTTTDQVNGNNCFHGPESSTDDLPIVIPAWRVSISAQTRIYLKGNATFSGGTVQQYGRLTARRVR